MELVASIQAMQQAVSFIPYLLLGIVLATVVGLYLMDLREAARRPAMWRNL